MSSSESSSLSPASVDRRLLDRSMEWMRRHSHGGWGPRHNLRAWNPWTNETKRPGTSVQSHSVRLQQSEVLDAVGKTTKAAGSVYEFLLGQEMQMRQQQLLLGDDSSSSAPDSSDICSSAAPVRPPRVNSNTNNKNPFSLSDKTNAGLRDIQRHKAAGKQTTIITQFKAAETNQDGKVDINIIMDSESNMSNAQGETSDEATTESSGAEANEEGSSATDDAEGQTSTTSTTGGEGNATATPDEATGGEEAEGEGDAEEPEASEELPAPGEEKKDAKSDKKKLNMGHLDKEGVVIGCMNVFADVSRKEYIVLLTDRVVEAFLVDPGQFRSIAKRTGCEIEVTRRILNRRIGDYRWVKYLIVTLRGPNLVAIDQCDRLMVKMFPPYKIRKVYPETANVALFVKESSPDNSDLYFNYQRTGPTCAKVGDLRLQTPFGKSATRTMDSTPWKMSNPRLMVGMLEPRNLPMEIAVEHVYPEWGSEKCGFMDPSCKWEQAGDIALEVEKKANLERSMRVKQRKLGAEVLFAGGD